LATRRSAAGRLRLAVPGRIIDDDDDEGRCSPSAPPPLPPPPALDGGRSDGMEAEADHARVTLPSPATWSSASSSPWLTLRIRRRFSCRISMDKPLRPSSSLRRSRPSFTVTSALEEDRERDRERKGEGEEVEEEEGCSASSGSSHGSCCREWAMRSYRVRGVSSPVSSPLHISLPMIASPMPTPMPMALSAPELPGRGDSSGTERDEDREGVVREALSLDDEESLVSPSLRLRSRLALSLSTEKLTRLLSDSCVFGLAQAPTESKVGVDSEDEREEL